MANTTHTERYIADGIRTDYFIPVPVSIVSVAVDGTPTAAYVNPLTSTVRFAAAPAKGALVDITFTMFDWPNPPFMSAATPLVTWVPNPPTAAHVILTNGATTAEGDVTNPSVVLGSVSRTMGVAGKVYFEAVWEAINGGVPHVGVAASATGPMDIKQGGGAISDAGNSFNFGVPTVGEVTQMAIDFGNRRMWFGRNGTWHFSGDPATGVSPTFSNMEAGEWKAYANVALGARIAAHFAASSFVYPIPAGFSPW